MAVITDSSEVPCIIHVESDQTEIFLTTVRPLLRDGEWTVESNFVVLPYSDAEAVCAAIMAAAAEIRSEQPER
jgi:hypothetical protein